MSQSVHAANLVERERDGGSEGGGGVEKEVARRVRKKETEGVERGVGGRWGGVVRETDRHRGRDRYRGRD